ncbi:MAG: DUF4304 domain-containing protein [Planctomycetes bacterium]|nr:DUF4304 domain-containing protein [Planctomycetota bacterium]
MGAEFEINVADRRPVSSGVIWQERPLNTMASKTKSEVVRGIDQIQSSVVPLLKETGFRKRGRSFNRPADDGLVHVVTFQAGDYPVGDNYEIPGLRESLYGQFTVNLGVFIPEVFTLENDQPPPKFLQEYHCEIRKRLVELANGSDVWWSATTATEETAAEFPRLFQEYALPFFARFTSHQMVLDEWKSHGELPLLTPGRSSLAAAAILMSQGNAADATAALQNAIAVSPDHKGFQEYVHEVAAKLSPEP